MKLLYPLLTLAFSTLALAAPAAKTKVVAPKAAAPKVLKPVAVRLKEVGGTPQLLLLSPDQKTIFYADGRQRLALDLASNTPSEAFKSLPGPAGAISPDGMQVLSPRYDFWLIFSGAHDGKLIEEMQPLGVGFPSQTAYSPDGKFIAVAGDATVSLLDAATRKRLAVSPITIGVGAYAVAFSPDSSLLAASFGSKNIEVFSTRQFAAPGRNADSSFPTFISLASFAGSAGFADQLQFSPDGKTLFSGDQSGALSRWDLAAKTLTWRLEVAASPLTSLQVAPSGQSVLVSAASLLGRASSMLVDAEKGKPKLVWNGQNQGQRIDVRLATFGGDGQTIYAAANDGTLWKVPLGALDWFKTPPRAASINLGRTWKLGADVQNVQAISFSPDGKWVAVAADGAQLLAFEVATGARKTLFSAHKERITSLVFSPDGTQLASGGWDGLEITDFASGQTRWMTGGEWAGAGGFSADGQTLFASIGPDIKRFSSKTGQALGTIASFGQKTQKAALSPDGKRFAVAYYAASGRGNSVRCGLDVFDIETGKRLLTKEFTGYPTALAWSANSQLIALDNGDYSDSQNDRGDFAAGKMGVSVWNVELQAAVQLSDLNLHSPVSALAFSPDGTVLARSTERRGHRDAEPNESGLFAIPTGTATRVANQEVPEGARALAFSRDATLLVAGFDSGPLQVFKIK